MTTKLKTKHDQLNKKRGELETELTDIQEKINAKKRELGAAVLANGSGSGVKITGLEKELQRLQDREEGLQAAVEAGQDEIEKSRDQVNQEDFKTDQAEFKRISKRINEAALGYIRDFYKTRDDLGELAELYQRGRAISKKHEGKLPTLDFTKSGQIIGVVRSTVVPISRSIEFFAADLVKDAGEKRRF